MSTGEASQPQEVKETPKVSSPDSPKVALSNTKLEDGGDSDGKSKTSEGGKLQFYLDGKIILELSDRRENGKTWWVPVTQKTYWPPRPSSCSTPGSTVRQESSASYSVSDDSSVQSSPWMRESRWKNPNPTKRREEDFTIHIANRERCRLQWTQRRRPFRLLEQLHIKTNAECSQCKLQWRKKARHGVAEVTSRLLEKAVARKSESLVSPRKRLLRDMEKVKLHDGPYALKKAKAVLPPASSSQPSKVYDRQSSYSIDSLLNSKESEAANSSFLRSLLRKTPPCASNGHPRSAHVWLPFPPPPGPALSARPGPSRMPSSPDCSDDDDAPLNLTISRARDNS